MFSCKKEKGSSPEGPPTLNTCKPTTATVLGRLSFNGKDVFSYTTSGGGKVDVDLKSNIKFSYNQYPNFYFEMWGTEDIANKLVGTHESLNGKHLKDRAHPVRTFTFPDGAKITIVSEGIYTNLLSITIMDGSAAYHYNVSCQTLEYANQSSDHVNYIDNLQADGETTTFELTELGLMLYNIYIETTPGQKQEKRENLGELHIDNPKMVNDYYDDPRMAHT